MNVTQLFIVWQKSVNLRGLCFVTALCFKLTDNHESSINVSRRDWVPNQPQSFVFSVVNKIIIGTCYLVYKLPSHLIPLTDCCACINCDLCRLPSIQKKKRLCSNVYWCWHSTKSKQTWHVFIWCVWTWPHWAKLHP